MKRTGRILKITALLSILILCTVSCAFGMNHKDNGVLTVKFIDVGKGDCILLEKDGEYMLIDTGYDATATSVLYYLQSYGVERLESMIITHYDKDHVGGAYYLAQNLEIGRIYLPAYEGSSKAYNNLMSVIDEKGIVYTRVTEDQTFSDLALLITIYASGVEYEAGSDEEEGNDNDCSLVVSVVYGKDSYLFAGDIEKDGIKSYLSEHSETYDILKIPHHGKNAKNSETFITTVSPIVAVITDSVDEPADEAVLDVLDNYSIAYYQSSVKGDITITSNGTGEYEVLTEN